MSGRRGRLVTFPLKRGLDSSPLSAPSSPKATKAPPSLRPARRGPTSDPQEPDGGRDALLAEAMALFSRRYRRQVSVEEARLMTERLTSFFSLLLEWDRRQRGSQHEAA